MPKPISPSERVAVDRVDKIIADAFVANGVELNLESAHALLVMGTQAAVILGVTKSEYLAFTGEIFDTLVAEEKKLKS